MFEFGTSGKRGNQLEGFTDFDKLLKVLPRNVENRVLQGAINAAARIGAKAVKDAAPTEKHLPPSTALEFWRRKFTYGYLKKNLKVRISKRDKTRGGRGAYITTNKAFWGFMLEKGTRYISAKPWFFPAFKKAYPAMIDALAKNLGSGIEKEALKQTDSGKAVRDAIDGL